MSASEVSVLLCRHTADNVQRIVDAIPDPNDPTYFTAVELAYDDNDPYNDARRNVAEMQIEALKVMAGTQEEMHLLRKTFYGAFIATALAKQRTDLKLLFVDAGRTTNGAENLERVTKGFGQWSFKNAWDLSAGNPEEYILKRGRDIADSLDFRENLVADQVQEIFDTNQHEQMSVIVGANHYGLLPLLSKRGVPNTAIMVDKPTSNCEMAVANMIRRGGMFDPQVLCAMGLAEWLSEDSGNLFIRLRSVDELTLRQSAELFYANPDIDQASLPVFQTA